LLFLSYENDKVERSRTGNRDGIGRGRGSRKEGRRDIDEEANKQTTEEVKKERGSEEESRRRKQIRRGRRC
jgi:hypothetical protein